MKIQGEYPKIPLKDKDLATRGQTETVKNQPNTQAKTGNVRQSQNSPTFLNESKKTIASTPEIDMARVKEMKDKIKSGKYTIDPNTLADKLLDQSKIEKNPKV